MFKLVTFDLDDTLWDPRPALRKGEAAQYRYLRERHPEIIANNDQDSLLALRRKVLKSRPELKNDVTALRKTFLFELLVEGGVQPAHAEVEAQQAFECFYAHRHEVALFEGALEMLTTLKQQATMIGALTNGNTDLSKTPLGACFDFSLRAEDVGAAKPAPELFLAALAKADVDAADSVHIGDHLEKDVAGAAALGIHTVWLDLKATAPPAGPVVPDATITTLDELVSTLVDLHAKRRS